MRTLRHLVVRLAPFALAVFAATAAWADDLPGRVGRIADVAGRVHVATGERAEDWLDAQRNDTITSGDNLWVAGDGRVEIDYGGGQVRLAGDTNVHFARLDDAILAIFVAQGRIIVRVRVLDAGEAARIDTPNTQIALTRPGLYRIDVAPERTRTEIVVREGEATASYATGIQQVLPGQTALLEGEEPAHASVRNGFYVDGFDTWSADRDRRYERSRSASYVSRQMIGYADLDEYGRWEQAPEYGAIWYPTSVVAGWAPYRYGRWAWVHGWGWTWVDDAPWGYAPFHYGRWIYFGGRWGWAPGALVARPYWSPAMVAWYGGSGWSFSATFGAPVFGWVPLGWGEPFLPWWAGCSRHCWTHYNRPYAVNLAERPNAPPVRYANWSVPGGVTAVAGATFTGRRPVHANLIDVKPQVVHSAPVLAHAPRVDKPLPGRLPGARPPTAAPMPAAAIQTKPMRLPPSPTLARPLEMNAVPPAGIGQRPGPPEGRAPAAVPPGQSGGARPPARAPTVPGTWGATGQPAAPHAAVPPGEPRVPTPRAEPRPPVRQAPPVQSAPPAQQPSPAPRAVPPPTTPAVPRATPPVPYTPPPVPYTPPPVPRSAPPGAAPGGNAVVPRAAPPGPAPQAGQPPTGERGQRGGRVPTPRDGEGGGDAPGRPMPK